MGLMTRFLLTLIAALALTACGGGGGGPGTAEITDANSKDVAVAGAEAAKAATSSEEVPLAFKSGATNYPANALDVFALGKQIARNLYAIEDYSSLCDAGGSLLIDVPDNVTASSYTATATYDNCAINSYGGYNATINGTITVSGNNSAFSISANLSVTAGGETESFTYSATCTSSGSSSLDSCTYSSSFTGDDGRSYSISGITVSGDDTTGYTISGRVTDPDHGVVTIATTTPVKFECPNGNPSEGVITVTGDATVTVTFIDCDSFSVTFDGTTTVYTWASI